MSRIRIRRLRSAPSLSLKLCMLPRISRRLSPAFCRKSRIRDRPSSNSRALTSSQRTACLVSLPLASPPSAHTQPQKKTANSATMANYTQTTTLEPVRTSARKVNRSFWQLTAPTPSQNPQQKTSGGPTAIKYSRTATKVT